MLVTKSRLRVKSKEISLHYYVGMFANKKRACITGIQDRLSFKSWNELTNSGICKHEFFGISSWSNKSLVAWNIDEDVDENTPVIQLVYISPDGNLLENAASIRINVKESDEPEIKKWLSAFFIMV